MGLLMDTSAYTRTELQAAAAVVAQAMAAGLDLAGLRALLTDRIRAGLPEAATHAPRPAAAPVLCPSCGRGPLAPVANRDGLRIVGCRLCRYSTVEGGG